MVKYNLYLKLKLCTIKYTVLNKKDNLSVG